MEEDDIFDDDLHDDDYYWEREQEELQQRAMDCECGAWQILKTGVVIHVADCCCGAE